jgi:ribosomal protein S24E
LFKRKEVNFNIREKSTPNKLNVRIELSVALKTDVNHIYIRKMETKSGTNLTIGLAHVYDDSEQALLVEPKYIIKRNQSNLTEEE